MFLGVSEPSYSNRRSPAQDGMVLAVRDHLKTLLANIPTPFPCHFACFIHPRRRAGEHGFGTITLAGESLPLTVMLLESLRRMPTAPSATYALVKPFAMTRMSGTIFQ